MPTKPAANTYQKWGTFRGQPQRFVHNHHTRTLRHDVFAPEWLRTEAGAWFMGLWTADGHLGTNGNLGLNMIDRDAVLLAADAIGYPRDRVRRSKRGGTKGQSVLRVGVKYLLPRLRRMGVVPGPKTFTVAAPPAVAFDRHYWRGVMDGDGWVSLDGSTVSLVTASPRLRDEYLEFLRLSITVTPKVVVRLAGRARRRKPLYQIGVTGDNAATLARFLYEDSVFRMDRKSRLAEQLIAQNAAVNERRDARSAAHELAIRLYGFGLSCYEIERRHGISAAIVLYA